MRERVSVAWYAVLASLASLPFMLHFQLDDPVNKKGTFELWELEGEPIGRLLDRHFGARQPLYAIDAAGCLGFWSKLPALDMLGLNDRYIALHPPAKIGVDLVGHEFGDGLYVLSREPDLVQFGVPQDYGGPKYASERVMMADPRFRRAYVQVTFLTFGADQRPVVSKIWVNKTSPRSGVVDRDGGLSIPGYLFASENDLRARESSDGRLGTRIPSGRRAGFGLELPNPGRWNVRVTSEGSVPRIALGSGHASSLGIGTAAITAPLNALRIEIEPTGADVDVFEVMATHGIEPLGLGRQTDTRIH